MDKFINKVIMGDCLIKLKELEDNSVDSICCDPPYELGFMGKSWDNTGIANNIEMWAECLRVLKPGGHLLAFSGTRTYHRMASAIEDAGFEVRDMIEWVYGSGFPKSLNIGKAIDRMVGAERKVVGMRNPNLDNSIRKLRVYKGIGGEGKQGLADKKCGGLVEITEPNTEKAKQWEGWGTALKPAHEPICMARKPLAEKTVAENCLKWGTGGINIDESRVFRNKDDKSGWSEAPGKASGFAPGDESKMDYSKPREQKDDNELGRFPANLIHDNSEEVRECFPESKSTQNKSSDDRQNKGNSMFIDGVRNPENSYSDSGNASRFFKSIIYQAKSSKSDRNKGLDCYLTVKYNGSIINNNKTLCKEENMVAVQLLQKVISEQELVSFNIDESGVNIMVQCHKDSLSIILTEINRIIGLKIYNSLMHSLTNESTQVVNSEMEVGGSLAENVADLKRWILTITKGNQELALGASRVVCEMLQLISVEENWKEKTNTHATVKPIALMEYLIKMVTPKGGIVLDPFAGSGTTGIACKNTNRNYILIEKELEYIDIINKRLSQ